MKKNYLISLVVLLIMSNTMFSQLLNSDFEDVKDNGLPRYWGFTFLFPVAIDETSGENTFDQIQFNNCMFSFSYATTEAKDGQYALQIENAYNVTQDIVMPGTAVIFNDPEADGQGWNPGVPIELGTPVTHLGFDYKFFPMGNDVAEATIEVLGETGNIIGTGTIEISQPTFNFNYVYTPINFISDETPVWMYIRFSMAKVGSVPTFGSRLIVDNVVTSLDALPIDSNEFNTGISVYPTLVENELHVTTNGMTEGDVNYTLINPQGKVVKQNSVNNNAYIYTLDVSDLASGMYFLNIESSLGKITKKIIKK